jgi:lipoprotein-releasing system permease protein
VTANPAQAELAKNLGVFLFEPVHVVSPSGVSTPMGMVPRMKSFLVVGIFESGFFEYDSTLAYISLKNCQEFLNMGDLVTGIEIRVDDIYRADRIAKQIEKKLGFPYWGRNWMEMNRNLFSALKLEKRVMFIILSLIVLVAAFNIISALIMIVMEKNKDIAILKTMGATRAGIMKIFIFQGIVVGAIGTFLGSLAGLAVAFNLEALSRFVEKLFGFKILPGDVYDLSELPSQVNYGDVGIIILGTLLISFLSTIYPSWRASRLDPAEALRPGAPEVHEGLREDPLRGSVEPEGGRVSLKVPAGAHDGKLLRLRGQGAPRLKGGGKGDLLARVKVAVPVKLSKKEREAIEELGKVAHDDPREELFS